MTPDACLDVMLQTFIKYNVKIWEKDYKYMKECYNKAVGEYKWSDERFALANPFLEEFINRD